MPVTKVFTCTVCDAAKGSGNRWLIGQSTERNNVRGYSLFDWDDDLALDIDPVDHFCSEQHAFTELQKHLRQDRPARRRSTT